MKKNKPLQCARTICKVSAIGIFLFCAALFAQPAKAHDAISYTGLDGFFLGLSNVSSWPYPWIVWKNDNLAYDPGFSDSIFYVGSGETNGAISSYNRSEFSVFSISIAPVWAITNIASSTFYMKNSYKSFSGAAYSEDPEWGLYLASPGWVIDPTTGLDAYRNHCSTSTGLMSSTFTHDDLTVGEWIGLTLTDLAVDILQANRGGKVSFCILDSKHDLLDSTPPAHNGTVGSWGYEEGFYNSQAVDFDDRPYMKYNYNFFTSTSTENIFLGNTNCCVGQPCDTGIDFTAGLDGSTLHIELSETCTGLGDGTSQYYLDSFNDLPENITFESDTPGQKQLCAWISGGTAEPFIQSFIANFYVASSSLGCFSEEKMEEQTFCSDESLGCGDFSVSGSVWSELFCGLKQLGCWLIQPASSSLDYVGSRINTLKGKFPLTVYYNLTDSLEAGFASSSSSRAGGFSLPMYSQASSSYYMIKVLDASSTEKAIGKTNANNFRKTQTYAIWGIIALIIILQLTRKKE